MKNNFLKFLIPILIFIGPLSARANITVTEFAWMGTDVSANDEWIEIYNSGSDSINLSGWTLNAEDGTPSINLSGTIGAGEYKLLERTDDTSFPGITALVIFTGAISNEGENFTLKDGSTTIENLNFSSGWPAGDSTSRKTMQRNGNSWVTATQTAGGPTTEEGDPGDENPDDNPDDGEEEEDGEEDEDEEEVPSNSSALKDDVIKRKVYDDQIFEVEFSKKAVAGDPIFFKAQALSFTRREMNRGIYLWNMGDGTVRQYENKYNSDQKYFYHTYEHPGTYTITLEYYDTYFEHLPPDISETFQIEIYEPGLEIAQIFPNGSIEIKNNLNISVDLADWVLQDNSGNKFTIPKNSIISSNKKVVFKNSSVKLNDLSSVFLFAPNGKLASSFSENKKEFLNTTTDITSLEEYDAEGEVLGVYTEGESEVLGESKNQTSNLVWFLLFIILVLIATIAVILIKKDDDKTDSYELLDE